jgi:hypothetical protein
MTYQLDGTARSARAVWGLPDQPHVRLANISVLASTSLETKGQLEALQSDW